MPRFGIQSQPWMGGCQPGVTTALFSDQPVTNPTPSANNQVEGSVAQIVRRGLREGIQSDQANCLLESDSGFARSNGGSGLHLTLHGTRAGKD